MTGRPPYATYSKAEKREALKPVRCGECGEYYPKGFRDVLTAVAGCPACREDFADAAVQ